MDPNQIRAMMADLFRQHSPLTIREGSIVVDQIIGPLALLLEPVISPVARIADQLSLPDPGEASRSDILLALGEHIGMKPREGQRSVAVIRLLLRESVRIDVPVGSPVFTAEGQRFATERAYTFAPNALSSVQYNGAAAFTTPPFLVVATEFGTAGVVTAGAIRVPGFIVPGLLGVTNDADSASVGTPQTANDFKEQLRLASSSRGLDTTEGARFALLHEFGSDFEEPVFVRAGDPDMKRDATYTRRLVGSEATVFSLAITRAAGVTTQTSFTVNSTNRQATASDAAVISWVDPVTGIKGSTSATPANLVSKVQQIPYGYYWSLVYRANAAFDESAWTATSVDLRITASPAGLATSDFVAVGRRGDPSFITREGRFNPANGNETFAFTGTLREVAVDRAAALYGFEGKVTGGLGTVPHRFLKQRPTLPRTAPLSTLVDEATQAEYASLAAPDFSGVTVGTDVLYRASFVRSEAVVLALGDGWLAGNTGEALTIRDVAAGVCLFDGLLVLGPTPFVPAAIKPIATDKPFLNAVGVTTKGVTPQQAEAADEVARLLSKNGTSADMIERVKSAVLRPQEVATDGYKNAAGNTSPVVMRRVADEHGFKVSGTFWTTDTGDNPAAITMARTAPGDAGAQFRWYEGFGLGISVSDGSGRPNVFALDNGANDRNLTVVGEEYVGGKMAYGVLAQTTVAILPRVRYSYEIVFGVPADAAPGAVSMTARIWTTGGTRPATPSLTYGAYVPTNRRDALLVPSAGAITGSAPNTRTADYVGIGVSQTQAQHYWTFSEFEIRNVDREYAQALLEIRPAPGDTEIEVMLVARASGYGTTAAAEAYGHDLLVWNVKTSSWDLLAAPNYGTFSPQTTRSAVALANRVSPNGRLYFLISARHPHQGGTSVSTPSTLEVDYVEGGAFARRVHAGGKADLYVSQPLESPDYRPSEVRQATLTGARMIEVDPALLGGPVEEVISLIVEGGGLPILLDPSDYRYFWKDPDLRGSMRERLVLAIDPTLSGVTLTLSCRVHTGLPVLQAFLQTSDDSKSDADVLAFHKQSVFVDVVGEASGPVAGLNDAVRSWVASLTTESVRLSALVDFLYSQGATSVALQGSNRVRTSVRRITSDGNADVVDTEVLTRSRTERFVPGDVALTLV